MAAEFTDNELHTIARIELIEAQMNELSARDPAFATNPEYQRLVEEHGEAYGPLSSAAERQRLFWASAEAGRACRASNYESITP
jgi:hypothetical protein